MKRESVSNNLYNLRTEYGVTQQKLGEILCVTRQTIIAIEKGNYIPSVLLAMKIAKFFKKSVEDIFRITHER